MSNEKAADLIKKWMEEPDEDLPDLSEIIRSDVVENPSGVAMAHVLAENKKLARRLAAAEEVVEIARDVVASEGEHYWPELERSIGAYDKVVKGE